MYKDKDKQREAVKEATRRYRAKNDDSPLLGQKQGLENARGSPVVDELSDTQPVIPSKVIPESKPKTTRSHKRGKDIKCFADLPPDVQKSIDRMSINKDGTVNQTIKANRTAIAVNYQHLFPDRFEPNHLTGITKMVTGKPGDADYNGICTPEWRQARGR